MRIYKYLVKHHNFDPSQNDHELLFWSCYHEKTELFKEIIQHKNINVKYNHSAMVSAIHGEDSLEIIKILESCDMEPGYCGINVFE